MLSLSRRQGEKIYFPNMGVFVHVLAIRGGKVRLGIEAPPEAVVLRAELREARAQDRPNDCDKALDRRLRQLAGEARAREHPIDSDSILCGDNS